MSSPEYRLKVISLLNNDDCILFSGQIEFLQNSPPFSVPHLWNPAGNVRLHCNPKTFRIVGLDELYASLLAK
jgi:hypothetical protein